MDFSKNKILSAVSGLPEGVKNSRTVRWYVMVLPSCHKGSAKGLQQELDRRIKHGETTFEFFAPSYVEVKRVNGEFVDTRRPLLYNYVFIHASENEIFRMKRQLPWYNFLPRVRDGQREYYPFLTDNAMKNLQWVARSYSNVVPVYAPESEKLRKGDKVRITEGQFKGVEASIVSLPDAGKKDMMVCVENWMWVPLLHVLPGQYEVIALNTDNKHVYTHLDNDRALIGLHEALQRYYSAEGISEADRDLATRLLKEYGNLRMDTDVLRCKLYSILLPAYTLLGMQEEIDKLLGIVQGMLPLIKAEQSRALILTTLYGCTDSSIYHDKAHEIIDLWKKEENLKKSKQQLINRLTDYDKWLGH